MDKQSNILQQRIERTAERLAALKAQAAAREAREKTRAQKVSRAIRNRALTLLGVTMEAEIKNVPKSVDVLRGLVEEHLTRPHERTAALNFLDVITKEKTA